MRFEPQFSDYGRLSRTPAPVNAMMSDFAVSFRDGVDINLGVGYVNEATIPTADLHEAMGEIVAQPAQYRQAFNYGGAAGAPNLIRALRDYYISQRVGGLHANDLDELEFRIGASGATSLLDGIATILPKGIVVTSDPIYYIFNNVLERRGYRILAVPEDAHGVRIDLLEQELEKLGDDRSNISFFYFVTVNNPTCSILDNRRREQSLEIATRLSREQNRQIPLVFDTAYEPLLHDPSVPPLKSVLPLDESGIVYEIGTLSKILAPALRVGYVLGRPGPLLDALTQYTSDVGFSASLLLQEMGAYLLQHHVAAQLERLKGEYRAKALAVKAALESELHPYIADLCGGSAGFYYYLELKDLETHTQSDFFRFLARTTGKPEYDAPGGEIAPRVIYIPGEYCVHPSGQLREAGRRQLRISYGFESTPRIAQALALMREAAAYARSC